jgi:hypothetical protein
MAHHPKKREIVNRPELGIPKMIGKQKERHSAVIKRVYWKICRIRDFLHSCNVKRS